MAKKKDKKERNFLQKFSDSIMVLLNILAGVFLLICAKFSIFSPNDVIFSSYPNYLLLPMWILNFLFLLHWIFRKRLWGLMSLALIAITFTNMLTWFPLHIFPREHPMGKEIKLLTYNTMQFAAYVPHTTKRPNPIIKYIQNSDADIVCLQEGGYKNDTEYITKPVILKELKMYPYHSSIRIEQNNPNSTCLWIFSKYPILHSQRIPFNSTTNASFYCDILVLGTKIRVINNHLESNKLTSSDKVLYQEIINQPDKEKISEVAHKLGGKLTPAAVSRAEQAEKVASCIQSSPYPVVACGDFNDIPNSYTYRTIQKGLVDAWKDNEFGLGITFHEKFYLFRIDYIMHSPELISYGTHVDKVSYSDHYPLWSYIQLP